MKILMQWPLTVWQNLKISVNTNIKLIMINVFITSRYSWQALTRPNK